MANPANSVDQRLLRHLHLVVNKAVALPPQPSLELILDTLLQAPQLVQHSHTVAWRYLAEPPRDGTNILTWQAPQMKSTFPSDGYIWLDPEVVHQQDVRGHRLEMLAHRSGFRPGREQIATHARRRYRMLSNPSLWLVCYRPADVRDQQSAIGAPLPTTVRTMMQDREILGRTHTQLIRKEFMLYDTQSFPVVMPPGVGSSPHGQQNMEYPGNVMAHMNKNQQAAYKHRSQQQQQQQQVAAMETEAAFDAYPSKRLRRGSYIREPAPSTTAIPGPLQAPIKRRTEEEEQENAVDYMDSITPRELALNRYLQHHEWLEEILSSPYDTHQIVPPQLGLGRKGELESLTQDFFDAPLELAGGKILNAPENVLSFEQAREGKPVVENEPIMRVGKLDGTRAEEFREKASKRLAIIATETEEMEHRHSDRMAQIRTDHSLKTVTKSLRIETLAAINNLEASTALELSKNLDSEIRNLERKYGKTLKTVPAVECLDRGGLEEKSSANAKAVLDENEVFDIPDLGNPSPSIPENVTQENSDAGQANGLTQTPGATAEIRDFPSQPDPPPETEATVDPTDSTADDYVMVTKTDGIPSPEKGGVKSADMMDYSSIQADTQELGSTDLAGFDEGQDMTFEPTDFGDGIDFGDMDTAGDALSGYAQEIVNMGGGKRDDLGPDSPTVQSQAHGMGANPAPGGPSTL